MKKNYFPKRYKYFLNNGNLLLDEYFSDVEHKLFISSLKRSQNFFKQNSDAKRSFARFLERSTTFRYDDSHTASFKFIQLSTLRAGETGTSRSMLKVRWVLEKFYRARNSQI